MIKQPTKPLDLSNYDYWNQAEYKIKRDYFSHIVYCQILKNDSFNAVASNNTNNWVTHHLNSCYPQHDPAVHHGRYGTGKMIWHQINKINNISTQIMSERKDFGMQNGMTIAIRDRLDQNRAWFTLGGQLTESEILEIYFDKNIDQYFLDLHTAFIKNMLLKTTNYDEVTCMLIALSDYEPSLEKIAEKVGLSLREVEKIYTDLFRTNLAKLRGLSYEVENSADFAVPSH